MKRIIQALSLMLIASCYSLHSMNKPTQPTAEQLVEEYKKLHPEEFNCDNYVKKEGLHGFIQHAMNQDALHKLIQSCRAENNHDMAATLEQKMPLYRALYELGSRAPVKHAR